MNNSQVCSRLRFPTLQSMQGYAKRMPMPSFIGSGTSFESQTSAAIAARHASTQDGDIEIVGIETAAGEVGTISTVGWEQVPGSPLAASDSTLALWWHRFASGDALPTIDDAGDHMVANIHAFRGCKGSGSPIEVVSTAAVAATSSPVAPEIQTISWNSLLVMFYGFGRDSAATNGNLNSGYAITAPEGTTWAWRMYDRSSAIGSGGGYYLTVAGAPMPGIYTPGGAPGLSFAYSIYTLSLR